MRAKPFQSFYVGQKKWYIATQLSIFTKICEIFICAAIGYEEKTVQD